MKHLFCSLLILSGVAHADSGLDSLKTDFAGVMQAADAEFNRALAMQIIEVPDNSEISREACVAVMELVRPNYKVDPFEIIYSGGRSVHLPCTGIKFHMADQKGLSAFGSPFTRVLQADRKEPMGSWLYAARYFLDDQYRIVEIQTVGIYPRTGERVTYEIVSVDGSGNVYQSDWTKNVNLVGRDIEGTERIQTFIAADGSYPHRLMRRTIEGKDPAKSYGVKMFEKADVRDWQGFELPITHAWSGGFYLYGGNYQRLPNSWRQLVLKMRGGKDLCGFGSTRTPSSNADYPSSKADFYSCLNN